MEAGGQPGLQARLGLRQIDAADADLGESELMPPLLQPLHQRLPVELMADRHGPILETRLVDWDDEEHCRRFAASLVSRPALRDAFIALRGDLGAGKTTFVRHLLRALGVLGRIKSPTYAVVEPYELAGLAIWHFDFYRFNDPREWEDAGFRDVFAAPGLKLAEWPDKAGTLLPTPDLQLQISVAGDTRRQVRLDAFTPRGQELLA